MIKYYIPDFVKNHNVNLMLLNLMEDRPYLFYDDFEIGAVFGNFPNCTWNGGRAIWGRCYNKYEQQAISEEFNTRGVPLRLVMTNLELTKNDVHDRYANYIMKNLHNGFNQVLVASPILEEYIRKEYYAYPIVRSILAAEDIYYDDSDKYLMSVLKRNKNIDIDFLQSIEHKEKVEILVNETCHKDCTREYDHYRALSKIQLFQEEESFPDAQCVWGDCRINRRNNPYMISRQKIKEIYEPMGFCNFKLAGRGNGQKTILDYAHYMVKPEHQYELMEIMILQVATDFARENH